MNSFYKYDSEKNVHKLSPALFWDYDISKIDWQEIKGEVVKRVLTMGRLSDFFAAFDLYGGIKNVREIAINEVDELTERDLDFMCQIFNIKKEKTLCYKNKLSRTQLLNS